MTIEAGGQSTLTGSVKQRSFSIEKAEEAQRRLAKCVEQRQLPVFPPCSVAGVDVHYNGSTAFAAIAVLDYATLRLLRLSVVTSCIFLDYVPTFLAFREAPAIFRVLRSCRRADVLLVNGHGLSHPRGCGLATHVGVVEKTPTIGVALKPLANTRSDSWIEIEHGSSTLYASVGNLITLGEAEQILRNLLSPDRNLPLPLYLAHQTAQLATRCGH